MPIELIHKLQPFAIALILGLLIGIERERSHPPGYQPLGLRTFILLSLLGALAAYLKEPWIAISITFFVGAAVIAGYILSSKRAKDDIGITTEIAAVVTYALGYLAYKDALITLIIGLVVLIVLFARTRLHTFSRSQLRPEELQAAIILLVIAFGILPFLPDKTIDPWNLFNPLRFGILVLTIAVLQFCAYAGIRIFGATQGLLLSGFLAGFVSSTAATATLSNLCKRGKATALVIALAIVLATVAMFAKLLVIVFLVSPSLFYLAGVPALLTALVFTLMSLLVARFIKVTDHFPPPANPLALGAALRLALFLGGMLVVVTLAQRLFGQIGQQLVVFLGGLVEVHGIVLALAILFQQGQLSLQETINSLGLVVIASFVSKFLISWSIIRNNKVVWTSLFLAAMLIVYILAWFANLLIIQP